MSWETAAKFGSNDTINFSAINSAHSTGTAASLTIAVSADYGNTGTLDFTTSTNNGFLSLGGNGSIQLNKMIAANFGSHTSAINIITVAESTITGLG